MLPTLADPCPLPTGTFHGSEACFPLSVSHTAHATPTRCPSSQRHPPSLKAAHLELQGTLLSAKPGGSPNSTPSLNIASSFCPGKAASCPIKPCMCVYLQLSHKAMCVHVCVCPGVLSTRRVPGSCGHFSLNIPGCSLTSVPAPTLGPPQAVLDPASEHGF